VGVDAVDHLDDDGVVAQLHSPQRGVAAGQALVLYDGDEVLAFRIDGGYASVLTVPAADVFAKPVGLDFPAAANLLLVGATAADTLRTVEVEAGDTVLVHGASGSVGVSVLLRVATETPRSRRASAWSFIRAIRGLTTIVVPFRARAGNWKQRLLPDPVGMTTSVSRPSIAAWTTAS